MTDLFVVVGSLVFEDDDLLLAENDAYQAGVEDALDAVQTSLASVRQEFESAFDSDEFNDDEEVEDFLNEPTKTYTYDVFYGSNCDWQGWSQHHTATGANHRDALIKSLNGNHSDGSRRLVIGPDPEDCGRLSYLRDKKRGYVFEINPTDGKADYTYPGRPSERDYFWDGDLSELPPQGYIVTQVPVV